MHFFQMMRWILGCIHQDQELQLEHELLKPTEALSAEASDPAGAEKKLLWSISEIDYIIILHGKRIICYPSASHNQKSASSTLSLDLIARSLVGDWGDFNAEKQLFLDASMLLAGPLSRCYLDSPQF